MNRCRATTKRESKLLPGSSRGRGEVNLKWRFRAAKAVQMCVTLAHTHHRIPSSLWSISYCQLSPSTDNVCHASLYTHVLRHTPYCKAHLCLYWDAHLYQYQEAHLCWVCSLTKVHTSIELCTYIDQETHHIAVLKRRASVSRYTPHWNAQVYQDVTMTYILT